MTFGSSRPMSAADSARKAVFYPEEIVLPLVSRLLNRPVKWVEDRREHFLSTTQQRGQSWDVEVAANAEGRLLGIRGRCLHDNGAYVPYGLILPASTIASFPGPYALEALDITLDVVMTNMVPYDSGSRRGTTKRCLCTRATG